MTNVMGKRKFIVEKWKRHSKGRQKRRFVHHKQMITVWFRLILQHEGRQNGFFWVLSKANQQRKGHELKDRTDMVNSGNIFSNHFTVSSEKVYYISKIFWSKQYFRSKATDVHPQFKIEKTNGLKISGWPDYSKDSHLSHSILLAGYNNRDSTYSWNCCGLSRLLPDPSHLWQTWPTATFLFLTKMFKHLDLPEIVLIYIYWSNIVISNAAFHFQNCLSLIE